MNMKNETLNHLFPSAPSLYPVLQEEMEEDAIFPAIPYLNLQMGQQLLQLPLSQTNPSQAGEGGTCCRNIKLLQGLHPNPESIALHLILAGPVDGQGNQPHHYCHY